MVERRFWEIERGEVLSPEKQRIKIAEACGWNQRVMAKGGPLVWHDGKQFRSDYEIPDYLNDLNACHEMEKVLDSEGQRWFGYELDQLVKARGDQEGVDSYGKFDLAHATAPQRCEAFLKCLNLWVEDPVSSATVKGLR